MNTDLQSLLTRQEYRIAKLIAEEQSEKMIADSLYISPKTVPVHKKNIRKKLGVKTNVGVAIRFVQSLEQPKKFVVALVLLLVQTFSVLCTNLDDVRVFRSSTRTLKTVRRGK